MQQKGKPFPVRSQDSDDVVVSESTSVHLITPVSRFRRHTEAPFTSGIYMHFGWSNHKRTPLSTDVHWDLSTQTTFEGVLCCIWPHSFSNVCANVSWATVNSTDSTDVLRIGRNTYSMEREKKKKKKPQQAKRILVDGWNMKHAVWLTFERTESQYNKTFGLCKQKYARVYLLKEQGSEIGSQVGLLEMNVEMYSKIRF